MNESTEQKSTTPFHERIEEIVTREKHILGEIREKLHVRRNPNQEFDKKLTFGQRLADRVAAFGGSWPFIIIFLSILIFWIILNSFILARSGNVFDPYPYILLNLGLSMLAAIQAPVIMMSQNRQSAKDRMDAENDYHVNVKAELEVMMLHEKLDDLSGQKWSALIEMQQTQIQSLTELLKKSNAPSTMQ